MALMIVVVGLLIFAQGLAGVLAGHLAWANYHGDPVTAPFAMLVGLALVAFSLLYNRKMNRKTKQR